MMYEEIRKKLLRRVVCQRSWQTSELVQVIERIIDKLERDALKVSVSGEAFRQLQEDFKKNAPPSMFVSDILNHVESKLSVNEIAQHVLRLVKRYPNLTAEQVADAMDKDPGWVEQVLKEYHESRGNNSGQDDTE